MAFRIPKAFPLNSTKQKNKVKTPIHGSRWSSPVVWGNQVWLTTALRMDESFTAVAVDKNSGKILHDIKVVRCRRSAVRPQVQQLRFAHPVIEAGRVYVTFGSPGTACLETGHGQSLVGTPRFRLQSLSRRGFLSHSS